MHGLNEDFYKSYHRAKEDPSIWYINHLKNYLDEIYPEFSYLSSTRLPDQASKVEQRKIAMTTQSIEINTITDNLYRNNRSCIQIMYPEIIL